MIELILAGAAMASGCGLGEACRRGLRNLKTHDPKVQKQKWEAWLDSDLNDISDKFDTTEVDWEAYELVVDDLFKRGVEPEYNHVLDIIARAKKNIARKEESQRTYSESDITAQIIAACRVPPNIMVEETLRNAGVPLKTRTPDPDGWFPVGQPNQKCPSGVTGRHERTNGLWRCNCGGPGCHRWGHIGTPDREGSYENPHHITSFSQLPYPPEASTARRGAGGGVYYQMPDGDWYFVTNNYITREDVNDRMNNSGLWQVTPLNHRSRVANFKRYKRKRAS